MASAAVKAFSDGVDAHSGSPESPGGETLKLRLLETDDEGGFYEGDDGDDEGSDGVPIDATGMSWQAAAIMVSVCQRILDGLACCLATHPTLVEKMISVVVEILCSDALCIVLNCLHCVSVLLILPCIIICAHGSHLRTSATSLI